MYRNRYSNERHILYPTIEKLLGANRVLLQRLRKTVSEWDPAPVAAVLFGSAARGDGGVGSDIDILLIRPLMNEVKKRAWVRQVHDLRGDVHIWSGNRLHVLDWTKTGLSQRARAGEKVVDAIIAEGRRIHGISVADLLGRRS